MTVDPDRLAGALICTGAVVGLVGSIATMSVFLGVTSFALVLLLGVYTFRKRKEGRLLAAAVVWFAALGALGGFAPFFSRFYGLLPAGLLLVGRDSDPRDGARHRGRGGQAPPPPASLTRVASVSLSAAQS